MVQRKHTTYAYPNIVRISHVGGCGPCSKGNHSEERYVYRIASRTDERNGTGVPNYRDRIANHVSASSDYSRYIDLDERAHVVVRNDARNQRCGCVIGSPRPWTYLSSYSGGYYEQYTNEYNVSATPGSPFSDAERVACNARAAAAVHSAITNRIRTGLLGETALAGVQRVFDTIKRPFGRASQLTNGYLALRSKRIRRADDALMHRGRRYDRALELGGQYPRVHSARAYFARFRRRRGLSADQRKKLNLFDAYALRIEAKCLADLKKDWLTYQFGFMNAVYDIDAAVNAVERSKAIEADMVRVTGYDDLNRTSVTESSRTLYFASFPSTTVTGADYRARYVFGILASSFGGKYNSVAAQLGFSARAFVPTLWAALPHSWAIDYFVNIDNLIDEWVNRSVKIVYGSFSTTSFRYGKVSVSGTITTANNVYSCALIRPATRSILAYNREAVGVLPRLELTFRVPTSWTQLANLFAVYSK